MTLEERLKEIEARGYAQEATCTCGADVPALLRMLRLAIQQRDVAFSYAYKPRDYHVPEANERLLKAWEGK